MPSAVSGLTNEEAPSAAGVPAGSGMQKAACAQRYSAYMPPPASATVLPSSAAAAADDPAATTVPAPSLPTGIGSPARAAAARMAPSDHGAMPPRRSAGPPATPAG